MRGPGGGTPINPIPYLTDGYRLDAPPGQSYVDEAGEQRNALDFDYATAADITRGVIGEDQVPAPVATATDILGGAFASASDLVAGGNRADYRTLGRTGVSTAQLEVTVAGEDDEEEKPSALGRLLGRGQ
jgi:hypothetical protein